MRAATEAEALGRRVSLADLVVASYKILFLVAFLYFQKVEKA